ncbi:hypothetical protein GKC29_18910 [Micromonospora sp. WMMC415]|uniref:hypothetical protein n=1 Tax=Micromonospora sp. WMMC415 TaxID=2675222 RepID=UPI0012B4DE9D|nr:hypothetical protein [Micromonospora sp. WMMC415]QGN48687.1 hypothetical protein GKC29_18910 [Micromonospora sp. WMMC415]
MVGQHGVRRAAIAAGLVAALLSGGCSRDPGPEPPQRPSSTSPPSTLARAAVGDRLTVTAAVERVIDEGAIVVRDVDLSDGSLLVLTRQAVEATPPQLVTVEGTVILFSSGDLAAEFAPHPYRAFDGKKALAAGTVTVWR